TSDISTFVHDRDPFTPPVPALDRAVAWRPAPLPQHSTEAAAMRVRPRGGLPGYRLRRVLDYIASNLAERMNLDRLAAVAGMSPHYFAGMFRQSMGVPPHRYLLQQRVLYAKRMLVDTRRSILDVALDAGFQNASHFARTFRRLAGVSPSAFRAEMGSLA